jgi:1-acyl-sn-glycerol-3-phosphate acyltransferase
MTILKIRNKRKMMEQFIRSLIFFIYSTIAICIFSLIVVFSIFLPVRFRHAEIRACLRTYFFVLKHVCHLDYQVEGLEHLSETKAGVILSKHQSMWETFFLPLIFHNPAIIAKRELLWIPFFGWGLAAADPISINRSSRTSAMNQIIKKGKKCLDKGRWVLVFPEGTRVPYGQVGHYKLGGARLAVATGYPVIPVANNAGRYWPKRKFVKHPGTIRVVIGPLIETKDKTPEEVMSLAKDWIEETMKRIMPQMEPEAPLRQ